MLYGKSGKLSSLRLRLRCSNTMHDELNRTFQFCLVVFPWSIWQKKMSDQEEAHHIGYREAKNRMGGEIDKLLVSFGALHDKLCPVE